MQSRERFTVPLKCAQCGQAGSAAWEENGAGMRRGGAQRELILLSSGFHRSEVPAQSGDPTIVCNVCDTAQPD
jgi:hypothetical protein